MILNHIWGLYTHPKKEWRDIEKRRESLIYSLIHTIIVTLIPAICCYYATAHIGWTIGSGESFRLSNQSAQIMALCMYFALVFGVLTLGLLIQWVAKAFDSKSDYIQSLELAAYTATPLIIVGVTALFPVLWFIALSVISAMIYSIYLLYSGVPIMLNIPEEKGFIYAISVLTCGIIFLVSLMAIIAMMWTAGFGQELVK
jgi:hypothetical protein